MVLAQNHLHSHPHPHPFPHSYGERVHQSGGSYSPTIEVTPGHPHLTNRIQNNTRELEAKLIAQEALIQELQQQNENLNKLRFRENLIAQQTLQRALQKSSYRDCDGSGDGDGDGDGDGGGDGDGDGDGDGSGDGNGDGEGDGDRDRDGDGDGDEACGNSDASKFKPQRGRRLSLRHPRGTGPYPRQRSIRHFPGPSLGRLVTGKGTVMGMGHESATEVNNALLLLQKYFNRLQTLEKAGVGDMETINVGDGDGINRNTQYSTKISCHRRMRKMTLQLCDLSLRKLASKLNS